jgi:hypothetical protein
MNTSLHMMILKKILSGTSFKFSLCYLVMIFLGIKLAYPNSIAFSTNSRDECPTIENLGHNCSEIILAMLEREHLKTVAISV